MPQMPKDESYVPNAFVKGCGVGNNTRTALHIFNNAHIALVQKRPGGADFIIATGTPRELWEASEDMRPIEKTMRQIAITAATYLEYKKDSSFSRLVRKNGTPSPATSFQMAGLQNPTVVRPN